MQDGKDAETSDDSWCTERFRVTVFPCNLEDVGQEPSWETLVGEAPSSVEQQPR